jgi:hypothetical protein
MPIDEEMDALLKRVENGSPFEALRAARQVKELAQKRSREREQANQEKEKLAATK